MLSVYVIIIIVIYIFDEWDHSNFKNKLCALSLLLTLSNLQTNFDANAADDFWKQLWQKEELKKKLPGFNYMF